MAGGARRGPAVAVWVALVTVYVVWGSTYLAIRVVVDTAPPLLAMGTRFVVAGLLVAAVIAVRRGPRALAIPRRELGACALVGALLLLGGNGLVAVAEQTVPSGLTALLIAATPLTLVCLRVGTGDRPRVATLAGTLLGFVGIAVLTLPGSAEVGAGVWGVLLVLAASVFWANGSFFSSRLPLPSSPFLATGWEMLLGGLALVLTGVLRGELAGFDVTEVAPVAWAALAYLILAGSLAAFSAYVWLLGNAPISLVATYAYVNPVVAIALGAVILGEAVTGLTVVAAAVIVVSVAMVIRLEQK